MNVRKIITDWLIENKYDGLFNFDNDCGCELADLFCCSSEFVPDCEPGYKIADPTGESDYLISSYQKWEHKNQRIL